MSFIKWPVLNRALAILLFAGIALSLFDVTTTLTEINLLNDLASAGEGATDADWAELDVIDQRLAVTESLLLFLRILTAIIFLTWIRRVARRVRALGAKGLSISVAFSTWWYVVPIASFWKPFEAMREIWQASYDPENWKRAPDSKLLRLWWAIWILSGVTAMWLFYSPEADEISSWIVTAKLYFTIDVLEILLCASFLLIMKEMVRMQANSANRIELSTGQKVEFE